HPIRLRPPDTHDVRLGVKGGKSRGRIFRAGVGAVPRGRVGDRRLQNRVRARMVGVAVRGADARSRAGVPYGGARWGRPIKEISMRSILLCCSVCLLVGSVARGQATPKNQPAAEGGAAAGESKFSLTVYSAADPAVFEPREEGGVPG